MYAAGNGQRLPEQACTKGILGTLVWDISLEALDPPLSWGGDSYYIAY